MNKTAIDPSQFERKILDLVKNRKYTNFLGSHALTGAGVGALGGGAVGLADTARQQMSGELEGQDKLKAYLNNALRYGTAGGVLGGTMGVSRGAGLVKDLKKEQLGKVKDLLSQGAAPDLLLKQLTEGGHLKDLHVLDYLNKSEGTRNKLNKGIMDMVGYAKHPGEEPAELGSALSMMHPKKPETVLHNTATPGTGVEDAATNRRFSDPINKMRRSVENDPFSPMPEKGQGFDTPKNRGKIETPEVSTFDAPAFMRAGKGPTPAATPGTPPDAIKAVGGSGAHSLEQMQQDAHNEFQAHLASVKNDHPNAMEHLANATHAKARHDALSKVNHHYNKYLKAIETNDQLAATHHYTELETALNKAKPLIPASGGASSPFTGGPTDMLSSVMGPHMPYYGPLPSGPMP